MPESAPNLGEGVVKELGTAVVRLVMDRSEYDREMEEVRRGIEDMEFKPTALRITGPPNQGEQGQQQGGSQQNQAPAPVTLDTASMEALKGLREAIEALTAVMIQR